MAATTPASKAAKTNVPNCTTLVNGSEGGGGSEMSENNNHPLTLDSVMLESVDEEETRVERISKPRTPTRSKTISEVSKTPARSKSTSELPKTPIRSKSTAEAPKTPIRNRSFIDAKSSKSAAKATQNKVGKTRVRPRSVSEQRTFKSVASGVVAQISKTRTLSRQRKIGEDRNNQPMSNGTFDQAACHEESQQNANQELAEGKDTINCGLTVDDTNTESIKCKLQHSAEKLEDKMEIYQELIQKIKKNGLVRSEEVDNVKKDLEAFVKDWIDNIKNHEKTMLEDIETTEKTHQEQDTMQISRIEQQMENMKSSMEQARKMTKEAFVYDRSIQEKELVSINEKILGVDIEIEAKPSRGYHQFIPNQGITVAIEKGGVGSLLDCVAEGDGLKRGTVGLKSKFTITTLAIRGTSKQSHYDSSMSVAVSIHADQNELVPSIQDNRDGTYDVEFQPIQTGEHIVVVTLNGQNTVESPYKVPVRECVVACENILKGTVGIEKSFTVSFLDSFAKSVYDPVTKLEVHLQPNRGSSGCCVQDNENGTYRVSFVPFEAGENKLIITVDGQELATSPYTVNVRKCVVTGEGTNTGKVGLKSSFSVAFRGRDDSLIYDQATRIIVKIKHSQGSEVASDIQVKMDGTFSVSYYPEQPGTHCCTVSVLLMSVHYESLQQEIPESPFTVIVKPREFHPVLKFGKKGTNKAELNWPSGVAVTAKDEIVVADCGNHRLQVFSKEGDYLRTIGKKGSGDHDFIKPSGVAIDKENNLIVLDKGNGRVQIFSEDGEFRSSFASRGKDSGQLENPQGIALDANNGNIIVTDTGNYRVQVFSNEGKWLLAFDCQNARHCVTHGGYYFVSTASENVVKVFDRSGAFVCKYGTRGASPGAFDWPTGLAVDKAGHLVVCDTSNSRVQVLNLDGTYIGSFGARGEGEAQFDYPACVSAMSDGQLVVCDARSNTVNIFK